MKSHDIPNFVRTIENMAGTPAFETNHTEEFKVNIRVNESVGPAMFKADPLIPGGYIANSLTIRAMKPDLFTVGDSLDDLEELYGCACGKEIDLQFWKLCPHCGRDVKP